MRFSLYTKVIQPCSFFV